MSTSHELNDIYAANPSSILIGTNFLDWHKWLKIRSSAYGDAGVEFLDRKLTDVDQWRPIRYTHVEIQMMNPDGTPGPRQMALWDADMERAHKQAMARVEERIRELKVQRGKLFSFMETRISPALSKEIQDLHSDRFDTMQRSSDTIANLALIEEHTQEVASKSRLTLLDNTMENASPHS
jgi:hypothetical protein